jgi:Lsr2
MASMAADTASARNAEACELCPLALPSRPGKGVRYPPPPYPEGFRFRAEPVHREWRSKRHAGCARLGGHPSISGVDLDVVTVKRPQEGYIWLKGKGGSVVAQKVSVSYACDYDQKEIPQGQHRLRRFSIDGRDYEIDLCLKHSERFDDALGRYASHARKSSARVPRTKRRTAAHRRHSAEVRAWAKAQGLTVSERGRIPAEVVSKYDASHS